MNFATCFESGYAYRDFLEKHGTEVHRQRWAGVHAAVNASSCVSWTVAYVFWPPWADRN